MKFYNEKNLMEEHLVYMPEAEVKDDKALFDFKCSIKIAQRFDDAIYDNIMEIAREEGLNGVMILNKQAIAAALRKSIALPMVPTTGTDPGMRIYVCPECCNRVEEAGGSYCIHCGQKLEGIGKE